MSRMPDDIESKYNHDNKFMWVDSQLEKFMNKVKELEGKIKELEKENKNTTQEVFQLLGKKEHTVGCMGENE